MGKKPLTGPMKYGDSKEERRRALDDAIKCLDILGHPVVGSMIMSLPAVNLVGMLIVPRSKNIAKVLKKMRKILK
tara:strand:- start:126 stop:350 length:225 start_codon:yes stop_codon:yes gene_type:complete